MYSLMVDHLRPGMVLATDILDPDGRTLLRAGTELSATYIRSLRVRGLLSAHIEDGLADDVPVRDIVSMPLRAAASKQLATVFSGVAMAARVDPDDRPADVDDTVRRLGEEPLTLDGPTAGGVAALFDLVEQLLSQVLVSEAEAGLESLKTHNDYTYQHSIDVAAVGAMIGYRAGLSPMELKELALGCLLHDIGKVYIDVAILDKPGPLSDAERADMQRHPYLGFELARRMPLTTIFPAHVAYQHHERQDGSGYPRGLVGTNRMVRNSAERFDPKRMLLIAEIAAVADVYSALTSDRPYRPALGHDVAVDLIAQMAGPHLNRDVVQLFHRTVPRYPVGHWVIVTAGRFTGSRGVVTKVPAHRPDRPTVRLLVDRHGDQMASPEEVDTHDDDSVELALASPPTLPARPAAHTGSQG